MQVDLPASVLKKRCVDRSERQWFFVPGGSSSGGEEMETRDPLWEAIRTRVRTHMRENKVRGLTNM